MIEQLIEAPSIIASPSGQQSPNGKPHHTFPELFNIWIAFKKAEKLSVETIKTYRWTAWQFVLFCERQGITPETLTVSHMANYVNEAGERPGRKKAKEDEEQKISEWGHYALAKDARAFLNWLHKSNYLPRHIDVPVPPAPDTSIHHLETSAEKALGPCRAWELNCFATDLLWRG